MHITSGVLSCMQACRFTCRICNPSLAFCHVCKCAIILAHAYHQWCPVMHASVQVHLLHMQATIGLLSYAMGCYPRTCIPPVVCMQACSFTRHSCTPPLVFCAVCIVPAHARHQWCPVMHTSVQLRVSRMQATIGGRSICRHTSRLLLQPPSSWHSGHQVCNVIIFFLNFQSVCFVPVIQLCT